MSNWIKAFNPTAPIENQDAALTAARVSAVGILLGVVNTIAEGVYYQTGGAEATQRAVESMTGQAQSAEQAAAAAQFGMVSMAVVVILHLVLAAVQFKKPNQAIPIIFLVLVIWGLGGVLLGLVMGPQMEAMGAGSRPMWLTITSLITLGLAAVLHISGIRGASALSKFRAAQAY